MNNMNFEILPEGAAGLFLQSLGIHPKQEDVSRMVELFRLYYERGQKDAQADRDELLASVEASRKLCAVYFQIAASVVGEDRVREIRDETIAALEKNQNRRG